MGVRDGHAEARGLAPPSAVVPVPLLLDGDRRQKEGRQSPTVRRGSERRACPPKARRSSESAIAAEVLMNNAGEEPVRH